MTTSDFRFGFRIVGATCEARRLVEAGAAFAAYAAVDARCEPDCEAYLSAFNFAEDFRQHLEDTGSTARFDGPCWSPWLWFDIDNKDLTIAWNDAKALADILCERYGLDSSELLLFFSGSKGFHLGLPTSIWTPAPSVMFHKIAKRFAENLATVAAVAVDTSVYDRVRAFRAPNSRHPKTSLYKRWLTFDELTGPLPYIRELAKAPAPFNVPIVTKLSEQAIADWQTAADQVAQEIEAMAARQAANNGTPTLNRLTLDFIRNGADRGDRHRRLYSAAANLSEFNCPSALAVALLEESARDSGLAPREVRRTIKCGLSAVSATSMRLDGSESPQNGLNASTVQEPSALNTDDTKGFSSQTCQQMTGTTVPTAAELAALWNRPLPAVQEKRENQSAFVLFAKELFQQMDSPEALAVPQTASPQPPISGSSPSIDRTPPSNARLYFIDKNMRPCEPADCFRWTWEGAPCWFDASDGLPPGVKK